MVTHRSVDGEVWLAYQNSGHAVCLVIRGWFTLAPSYVSCQRGVPPRKCGINALLMVVASQRRPTDSIPGPRRWSSPDRWAADNASGLSEMALHLCRTAAGAPLFTLTDDLSLPVNGQHRPDRTTSLSSIDHHRLVRSSLNSEDHHEPSFFCDTE